MILYTASEGRNLPKLRRSGWRLMLTPTHSCLPPDMRFALDNGAWTSFQSGKGFAEKPFKRLVERLGAAADFVIVPDVVNGGAASLDFSREWLPFLRSLRCLLLPVQAGMGSREVGSLLHDWPQLGLFLGGTMHSREAMYGWGMVAHSYGRYYHVGRVNTIRRLRLAVESGADSVDGSSMAFFTNNLDRLTAHAPQGSLLSPDKLGASMECGL